MGGDLVVSVGCLCVGFCGFRFECYGESCGFSSEVWIYSLYLLSTGHFQAVKLGLNLK